MKKYKVLKSAVKHALDYLDELPKRRVFPEQSSLQKLENLSNGLPASGINAEDLIHTLHEIGSENTVASNGGRYFGFVFGGTLPASLAASWLASAWDQNAVFKVSSPVAAHIEKLTAAWLLELLQLPAQSAVGFVTGTTMANFCGMIAARYHIY
jgi:glutamate/tyrosine decarboxylase-like PLP-dependent enzyme